MTPKKKAEELVNKYLNLPICESVESAKYASNICIKEILNTLEEIPDLQVSGNILLDKIKYWRDVQGKIYDI